jgi:hypothetical protein
MTDRVKLKIEIPIYETPPDPPPRNCYLCEEDKDRWQFLGGDSAGEPAICWDCANPPHKRRRQNIGSWYNGVSVEENFTLGKADDLLTILTREAKDGYVETIRSE